VYLRTPRKSDAEPFLAAVKASRGLHRPWVQPPSTPARFAAFVQRYSTLDSASVSHVGFVVCRREDDAIVGVRSTARLFGENTRPFLAACYAGAMLMLVLAGWLAGLGVWFYPMLILPAVLLARQVIALDIHDPAGCLRLFRSNREAGLAIGLAILTGWL